MAISEKSDIFSLVSACASSVERLTLGVQEVADWDSVILVAVVRLLLEHLLGMLLRPDTHVLLTKGLDMVANVGILLRYLSVIVQWPR